MRLLHVALSHGDNGLTRALRKVSTEYCEVPTSSMNLSREISHALNNFNPECVWIQIQSEGLTEEILKELHAHSAYVINWSGDVRKPIPVFYWEYAQYVDVTCFSNMNDVNTMRKYGYNAEFLQIGFDPEIYTPEGEKKQVEDIVFMGNNSSMFPLSGYRREMVQFLKQTYGKRFGVYGNGWSGLESGNYMGDQHGEAAVYRGAKIGINCSHFDYERYSSDRLFRMLGCGIAVASHKYKGITKDFVINDWELPEIWAWDDFDELKDIIDRLLANDSVRISTGLNGLEVGKKFFTFDVMAENIYSLYRKGISSE